MTITLDMLTNDRAVSVIEVEYLSVALCDVLCDFLNLLITVGRLVVDGETVGCKRLLSTVKIDVEEAFDALGYFDTVQGIANDQVI